MSRADQTGLVPAGRSRDGRYLYHSVSVMRARNQVRLTHDQRVGLAILHAVAQIVAPGTRVYPMTRQSGTHGYGTFGVRQLWIMRPLLSGENPERAMEVFTHELGHNAQPRGTRPHGPEFEAARVRMVAAVKKATHGYTRWPKLDMRKLRDSVAPVQKKRAAKRDRAAAKASETPEARWSRKVAQAEARLAKNERELGLAEGRVEHWRKKLAHAESWLKRSQK